MPNILKSKRTRDRNREEKEDPKSETETKADKDNPSGRVVEGLRRLRVTAEEACTECDGKQTTRRKRERKTDRYRDEERDRDRNRRVERERKRQRLPAHCTCLGKGCGIGSGPTKGHAWTIADAVQSLGPPLVVTNVKAGNTACTIGEKRDLESDNREKRAIGGMKKKEGR